MSVLNEVEPTGISPSININSLSPENFRTMVYEGIVEFLLVRGGRDFEGIVLRGEEQNCGRVYQEIHDKIESMPVYINERTSGKNNWNLDLDDLIRLYKLRQDAFK